jgi:hypothetical protein
MPLTPQEIVQREVCACASSLIATLAKGCDFTDRANAAGQELQPLCEQAFELACPVDDWEEAAIQAGFKLYEDGKWHAVDQAEDPDESMVINFANAEEVCREQNLEPYQWEVFEHWIVSDWFADKLIEAGEKVDKDFAGLCIWARTTTGQAIYADAVIERICAKLAEG